MRLARTPLTFAMPAHRDIRKPPSTQRPSGTTGFPFAGALASAERLQPPRNPARLAGPRSGSSVDDPDEEDIRTILKDAE